MSADQLAIAVTFLTGRYHGAEWPPSPARLYQALVAGVMTGGYRTLFPKIEPALRWLEQQQAPSILASSSHELAPYRIAVPNNDLDRAGLEWAAGRQANPAEYRTMKAIQSRTVDDEGPHVIYQWRASAPEIETWTEVLRKAARCLHTFGWGIDMAFADVIYPEPQSLGDRFIPSEPGSVDLNIPIAGTLEDLQASYQRFLVRTSGKGVDTHTRPSMFDTKGYSIEGERRRPLVRFRLLDADAEKPQSIPWAHCMRVAAWVRHAAADALTTLGWSQDEIASYIQGHTADGDKSRRVSYVPLPNISGPYPDGRIRRVIIVEPAAEPGNAARALQRVLSGRVLTNDADEPAACLMPVDDFGGFEPYVGSQASHTWRSVTPVVLHGFNVQRRGVIDVAKTEKLLLRAFEMAGYPVNTIARLSFQAGPLWRGTGHSAAMLVPQHLAKYPRVHVEVTFKTSVEGPILAGIGRHYGIGVFARTNR
ncbi:MAG TPA: type I-U CRISPR-associated protein Csb2 [Bryobacteraceae bacterium]|nr:type I-U CRISPR-associated protein Csb2 [Bryobacteraceae bacterium]